MEYTDTPEIEYDNINMAWKLKELPESRIYTPSNLDEQTKLLMYSAFFMVYALLIEYVYRIPSTPELMLIIADIIFIVAELILAIRIVTYNEVKKAVVYYVNITRSSEIAVSIIETVFIMLITYRFLLGINKIFF